MLSRIAENIYWLNRYTERAENYARFMDVNYNLSLELSPDESGQWKPLVVTTGDWDLYASYFSKVEKKKVIYFLGFDEKNPNSIFNCIRNARENAKAVRPEITKEVWEQINGLYYFVNESVERKRWLKIDPRTYFNEIKKGCLLLNGLVEGTLSKTEGWHFGKIGQLVERADKTSRILDVKYHMLLPSADAVGSPIDLLQWASLLKSVSAYDMYLKNNGKLLPQGISEFLIFDTRFPRSIYSCLEGMNQSLSAISGHTSGYINPAEVRLRKLMSEIESDTIQDVFKIGMHEYLDNFQFKLNDVSKNIYETYFSREKNITHNKSHQNRIEQ